MLRARAYVVVAGCGASVQSDDVYLNLVLEYIPETVYRVARHYVKMRQVRLTLLALC